MPLQLDSLRKAVDPLDRSLVAAHAGMESLGDDLRETVRAGVIQDCEIACEQCWKFVQRWLRQNPTPGDVDSPRTRKELCRLAARQGLIPDSWKTSATPSRSPTCR